MKKIIVEQTPHIDSEKYSGELTKEKLLDDNEKHIAAVCQSLNFIIEQIQNRSEKHDYTKIKYIDQLYKDSLTVQKNPEIDFKSLKWYNLHCKLERHHIKNDTLNNINLIDVIELVADVVVSGIARSGKIKEEYLDINPKLLQEAVYNTAELIEENITFQPTLKDK